MCVVARGNRVIKLQNYSRSKYQCVNFNGRPNGNSVEKRHSKDISTKHPFNWHINYSHVRHSHRHWEILHTNRRVNFVNYSRVTWEMWLCIVVRMVSRTRCESLSIIKRNCIFLHCTTITVPLDFMFFVYRFSDIQLLLGWPISFAFGLQPV